MLINQAQAPMTQSATFTPSHSPPRLCVCSHQNYLQGKGGQSSCVEKKKKKKPKAHMPLDGVKNIVLVRSTPHHLLSDR